MEPFSYRFEALGSQNEVKIFGNNELQARELSLAVESEIRRIETKYSRYRETSILSQINRAAGYAPVEIDRETAQLIQFADACYRQSGGLFDITSGVLRRVWDFKKAQIPSKDLLQPILKLIGWTKVTWDTRSIYLPQEGMEIDFGGFGKEYAVDQSITILEAAGVLSGYVNLGGDLRVIGTPSDRKSWQFGIAHPRRTGHIAANIELRSGALATSGDYERFFDLNGHRYCHILNPRTGFPVNDFQSVSVIAPASLIAGSCSTIAMLKGNEGAVPFLNSLGFPYLIIDREGNQLHQVI